MLQQKPLYMQKQKMFYVDNVYFFQEIFKNKKD